MKIYLLFLCSFLCFCVEIIAQCPPPGFPEPGNSCQTAPFLCQGVDGYCHTLRDENVPKNFRGCNAYVLNNDEWLSFIAGSTSIKLLITPSNCTQTDVNIGLQAGLYANCGSSGPIIDLQCECRTDPFILAGNNFIIGQPYYLVVDGCAGDICDYTVEVVEGSTVAPLPPPPGPISGDSTACGETTSVFLTDLLNGVTNYRWTLDPPNAGGLTYGLNNRVDIFWNNNFQGAATLCLQTENSCFANPDISCKTIQVTPTPRVILNGSAEICFGFSDSTNLNVNLSGVGPWGFTPTLNGMPLDPIITTQSPYILTVRQPGIWKIVGLYQTESLCEGAGSFPLNVTADTVRVVTRTFCPGESVLIGGQPYSQPGVVRYILPGPFSCNSVIDFHLVQLPQPERRDTIRFCPGESVTVNGQTYTQPGEVESTLPGPGCDTLVHTVLRYSTPAPSVVTIQCPQNLSVALGAGATHTPVSYDQPLAATDCSCPELSAELVAGLPSGAAFPVGATQLCYRAVDLCGQSAECCFNVEVIQQQDEAPCDVKISGCLRYELLSITADPERNQTYRIRVKNQCSGALLYTAIQLPDGVTAMEPANSSIFTSAEGWAFDVRNPNASPFYSIRFTERNGGMAPGASATFQYTLPAQSDPDYIHVVSRVQPQQYIETHLNTFKCPVTSAKPRGGETAVSPASQLRVYPNPANDRLWVDVAGRDESAGQWRIFNNQGALMLQGRWEGAGPHAIDLPESLASGLYFLEWVGEDGWREVRRWGLGR